jgi:hypothetical protein
MCHLDNTSHDNATFGVYRYRQNDKKKDGQGAVWRFVLLSLATTRRTKAFKA